MVDSTTGINLRRTGENVFAYTSPSGQNRFLALAETDGVYGVTLPETYGQRYRREGKEGRLDARERARLFAAGTPFSVREQSCSRQGNVELLVQPSRLERDYEEGRREYFPGSYKWNQGDPAQSKVLGIAQRCTSPFMDDIGKARALYRWLTASNAYGAPSQEKGGIALPSLKGSHRGDCSYYAHLLASLFNAAGIPARTVDEGYGLDGSKMTFGGAVMYKGGDEFGLVDGFASPARDLTLVPIPGRPPHVAATKQEASICHSFVEAQLGGKVFPFDPTWDLGVPEERWNYFGGFRKTGDGLYHVYEAGDAISVVELPESSLMANLMRPRPRQRLVVVSGTGTERRIR